MEKLNILLVHNYYQKRGGEDSVFEQEIEMLKENGHNVLTYTRNNNEINEFNIFKKLLLPFKTIYSFETMKYIKKIINENKIDIIHVHNYLNLISPSIFYIAKKNNIPIVQTIHNFRHLCVNGLFLRNNKICEDCINKGKICSIKHSCYRNSKLQTIIINIQMWLMKKKNIYKYINFIFLTEFNKSKFIQYNKKYNIFDENNFYIKPNMIKKDDVANIDNIVKKDQYVYVGRLSHEKGILDLVNAWKNIADVKLIICGDGPLHDEIKNKIEVNNLNIELKGQLERKEALKTASESKALIFPSLCYEGMPMTIIEAFMVNTPVIARNLGNAGMIVNDDNGFKYNDENELIDIVKNFNFNKKIKFELNENDNYNKLIEIYENILNKEVK